MSQQKKSIDVRRVSVARITELDALRGIAATSVLYFHLGPVADLSTPIVLGQYGVSLFFIISGFVITMTTSKGGIKEFIASRAARLYPTYWCAIIVTSIFSLVLEENAVPFRTIIINIPMIQSVLKTADVDGTYWTLAIEMQFYAVMAILLWLGIIKRVGTVCFVLLSVQLFCRVFDLGPALPWYYPLSNDFYLFVIGICIYQITFEKASIWTISALFLAPVVSSFGRFERLPSEVCLAVLVWLATSGKLPFLRWRPLVFVGEISFPLYLIHDRIGRDFLVQIMGKGVLWFFVVAVLVGLIATAIHYAVEEPLRPRLREILIRLARPAPRTSPSQ